jgi:hypothetical protein
MSAIWLLIGVGIGFLAGVTFMFAKDPTVYVDIEAEDTEYDDYYEE